MSATLKSGFPNSPIWVVPYLLWANSRTRSVDKDDEITIWTLDWVPMVDGLAGFVQDLRLRWACEVVGLSYTVRTVPIGEADPDHLTWIT